MSRPQHESPEPQWATLEFTIEPFVPSAPGPHVTAPIATAQSLAAEVEVGPFGTRVVGSTADIPSIAEAVITAALSNGASRVSLQVTTDDRQEMTP